MHRLHRNWRQALAIGVVALLLSACGSVPKAPVSSGSVAKSTTTPALPPAGSGRGGYYQDDGPADKTPDNLIATPDAVPMVEPLSKAASRPYVVFGKTYTPITDSQPFKQRGLGTWYGKKFHGQKTSSGERYDMFKMTAAHPTLPIPSYARVTNLTNGTSVIVRINDRGPFHSTRIIDLSYTAALKLGYLGNGSGMLEVERLLPEDIARINSERAAKGTVAQARPEPTKPEPVRPEPERNIASASPAAVVAMPLAPVELSVVTPIAGDVAPVSVTRVGNSMSANAGNAGTAAMVGSSGSSGNPAPATTATGVVNAAIADGASAPVRAGGIYLQFGAFAHMANAEAIRDRLVSAWASGQPRPEVVGSGALYRVTSGPFASRQDAEALARQVSASTGFKAVIVQR